MIIYRAINKINGNMYIGQTVYDLKSRIKGHDYDSKNKNRLCYFQNAIVKYGIDNFKWEVIDECNDLKWLNELEKYYIYYYDTFNNGYNLTTGGSHGWNHTEEANKRNAESHKGKKATKETRLKMSISRTGGKRNQQTKNKMRRSAIERNKNPEYINKLKSNHISKTNPEKWKEMCNSNSERMKLNNPMKDPEVAKKMGLTQRNKHR